MIEKIYDFFTKKACPYKEGALIKIQRGQTNDLKDRYVLARVLENCGYTPKWGTLLALDIDGTHRIHHIWTKTTEILDVTDEEAMLWKLENS